MLCIQKHPCPILIGQGINPLRCHLSLCFRIHSAMYYHTCTAVTCDSRLPYSLTLSVRPHKSIHRSSGYRNLTACGSL